MAAGHATQSVAIRTLANARLRDTIPQLHFSKLIFQPIIGKLNRRFHHLLRLPQKY